MPEPRDAKTVGDVVLDVQTGLGTRIEYWDNHVAPLGDKADLKRFIDGPLRGFGI